MLPDRCAVGEGGKRCPNPPEFVVSVTVGSDEYMIGVTCGTHRQAVSEKAILLQRRGHIPEGRLVFERLRPVGTDCVKGDPDALVGIRPLSGSEAHQ